MNFLFIFLLSFAYADVASEDLFEKTWPRDNSFCALHKKRVEILIRGQNKFVETKEYGYGEYAFFRVGPEETDKAYKMPLNHFESGLYKFFKGTNSSCSKSLGYPLKDGKFAILFLKQNRPYGHKLVIQIFDFKKMRPLDVIETNLVTRKVYSTSQGFIFKTVTERTDMDMGKVKIEGSEYIYQDRSFPLWMNFDSSGMSLDPSITYKKLPWRKYFKDEADFIKSASWDAKEKVFKNSIAYIAVNHTLKRKCVYFSSAKIKPAGTEDWRCVSSNISRVDRK